MSYLNIKAPFNKTKIGSAEELWSSFMDYAQHSDNTPLVEPKIFNGKDAIRHGNLDKIRPYTLNGFCNFVGVSPHTFAIWKKKEQEDALAAGEPTSFFLDVLLQIESIIYDQQYQGAAVDIFNSNIVSRKLGLADKRDIALLDALNVPDIDDEMTAREAAELYEQTLHPDKV